MSYNRVYKTISPLILRKQPLRRVIEELLAPQLKGPRVTDKGAYVLSSLLPVDGRYALVKESPELPGAAASPLLPMAALDHSRLQLLAIDPDAAGDEEQEVVPIAALDARLPGTAEAGMQLSGKEPRRAHEAHREGERLEEGLRLGRDAGRRIRIDLELNTHEAVRGRRSRHARRGLDPDEVDLGVRFDEG